MILIYLENCPFHRGTGFSWNTAETTLYAYNFTERFEATDEHAATLNEWFLGLYRATVCNVSKYQPLPLMMCVPLQLHGPHPLTGSSVYAGLERDVRIGVRSQSKYTYSMVIHNDHNQQDWRQHQDGQKICDYKTSVRCDKPIINPTHFILLVVFPRATILCLFVKRIDSICLSFISPLGAASTRWILKIYWPVVPLTTSICSLTFIIHVRSKSR